MPAGDDKRSPCAESAAGPPPTFGDLFAGIGGMAVGLERAGWRCLWHSEIEPYASGILAEHWPNVPNPGDITTIDWSTVERPTLVAGGFPCQDISRAGLKAGITGSRSGLWKSMVECIRQLRPRYVLVENVADLLVRGFDVVLGDLQLLGFDAEWSVVPACAMGASHSRPRLFVLAYPQGAHEPGALSPEPQPQERWAEHRGSGRDESRPGRWLPEPAVDRMADGLPRRVVFGPLAGLGNAVAPPVAEWIGRRILRAHTDAEAAA